MRFLDPLPCRCAACGAECSVAVRDLLALSAQCSHCLASFRDVGLSMRRSIDETATFRNAVQIITHVEGRLGITIADETVEAIRCWNELTLQDLVMAVERSHPSGATDSARDAVAAAIRAEFPNAPAAPDYSVPLLDAIGPRQGYGGY